MTASIAQFIGKPLASGGTELRSRRTGLRYHIEPDHGMLDVRVMGYHLGDFPNNADALLHVEAVDLSISAG